MRSDCLAVNEMAELLRCKPKTVRQKMSEGVFMWGVHYFCPRGWPRPLFKRSAVIQWIKDEAKAAPRADSVGIPMARGYILGSGRAR